MRSLFAPLALIAVATTALSAEPQLDPQADYGAERSNAVEYDVDFSAIVTAPYKTKVLKVWLPIPQSDFGQQVAEGELSTFPQAVEPRIGTEKVFGNKFAYFEFTEPQGAQIIRHKFKVKVWELRWNLDPDQIDSSPKWPAEFAAYLKGDRQSVVVDDRFTNLLSEIVPAPNNPLRDLSAVMSWVNQNFKYDHVDASLRASSIHAFENRHGHCSDYHGFCAAMGRALGFPTRVTYGINTFPKNSPSHCKLEAFLPNYGWVSFDVSETQKMVDEIKKDAKLSQAQRDDLIQAANERLATGFRDNTWYVQTKGTDYELEPRASRPVPAVRTIYAEADGVALRDPDPASKEQTEYAWMTAHEYTPDRPVTYPFKDVTSLQATE